MVVDCPTVVHVPEMTPVLTSKDRPLGKGFPTIENTKFPVVGPVTLGVKTIGLLIG
jgi:hypothetical protein